MEEDRKIETSGREDNKGEENEGKGEGEGKGERTKIKGDYNNLTNMSKFKVCM